MSHLGSLCNPEKNCFLVQILQKPPTNPRQNNCMVFHNAHSLTSSNFSRIQMDSVDSDLNVARFAILGSDQFAIFDASL